MGPYRPLFHLLSSFSFLNMNYDLNNKNWNKSLDGVLGIRTRGWRMEGADETTELYYPYANLSTTSE